MLGSETQRLLRKMQNDGYYKSTKNIFYFEADSVARGHGVDLKLVVEKENYTDTLSESFGKSHERYTFRNFYYVNEKDAQGSIFSNNNSVDSLKTDTLKIGRHIFVYKGRKRLKPDLLMNANHIADKEYFSAAMVDRTYNELFMSRLFKLINIRFVEIGEKDPKGNPMLDCYIQLTPSLNQSYSASIEGTNSLGNFGVAGNLGYQHKNLFRGGEIFDLQFLAGTQKQSYGPKDSTTTFHSRENGIDAKITIPKFIAPGLFRKANFFRYSTPQTFYNLSYNYQKTPDYTRTIAR